jgi:plastocyanin
MIYSRLIRPGRALLLLLSFFLATMPLAGSARPAAAQGVQAASVSVVDFAFEPATLEVAAGTTVTWTNNGNRPHTVTADDGSFDSGRLDPGEQFSHRFDQPGTYSYHCGFHPEMQATIVVTASDESAIEVATPAPEQPASTAEAAAESTAGPSRELTPVDPGRLAHIHAGTCDELGIVVYSLPNIRTYRIGESDSGVGAIELISGTANVPLSGLFGEPFSVHVHESAQNKQRYVACADVGGRPPAPWTEADGLVLEAKGQNDSGYSGFVLLQPSADGETNVTIMLAASPTAVEAAASQPAPPPSTTYKSPTFGYTIGYGPTWQQSENASSNGHDRFVLFNGTSYITFTGEAAFGGDPQACVDGFVKQLTADPNVSNLHLATDENGRPAQGGTAATGAYAIYNHDYTFPDRVEPYTLFVGCIPLVPNEAVLAIVQNVPTADYDEQVPLREALLRGLTLAQ